MVDVYDIIWAHTFAAVRLEVLREDAGKYSHEQRDADAWAADEADRAVTGARRERSSGG